MKPEIIAEIQKAGFDVYMRKTTDSYLLFTDGKNIGYLQADGCLSTVHIPNAQTGTGYQIERHANMRDILNRETLSRAFAHSPDWAPGRDRQSVKKYRDIAHYRAADSFNAGYGLVPSATVEA